MFCFQDKRSKSAIFMETTVLGKLRIQTVLDHGFYTYKMPRSKNPHSHLNYELYFIEDGECVTYCANKKYICGAGNILIINSCAEHNVKELCGSASIYSLRCSFHPVVKTDEKLCKRIVDSLGAPKILQSAEGLIGIAKSVRRELFEGREMSAEKIEALLRVFYIDLVREITGAPCPHPYSDGLSLHQSYDKIPNGFKGTAPREFYTDIIDDFFNHTPMESATLTELAKRLYLSVSQTQRLIRRYYGTSFQQKAMHSKIQKAARLIRDTDMPLDQIASAAGYRSYNAFFEAFSAIMKKTPSAYRTEGKSD